MAARRRKTETALQRVHEAINRLRREKAQFSVAAVARRADVSRTFLYDNPEARTAIATAMAAAGELRSQMLADQDDEREATWRERALNAEDALKAAHGEIIAQRARSLVNSSVRSGTCRPSGQRRPSSGLPRRAPHSSSGSVSSRPTTERSTSGSKLPAPTSASRTAASPTSRPASPIREQRPAG
ncbi:DUF6262 family protein [Streptomyces sp. NPDC056638]|uniref:DUF6262 family protein n=1 Tax=Streptomyces sp. NPDC056638 TaxID=3345887 RepID=UPI0036A4FEBB